ncbi:unnamed protein product [Closterium sp. Naga37s-1]|nr:unnamed protein product [Closterium sp. Naga37s-1]
MQILGSPIGTPQGYGSAVRGKLETAAEPLPLLAQMDPQLSLLLLTRRVSRRASFLARTTPLEVLPDAEWSAWGEQLLLTFLEAAHIVTPRSEAERRRIWRQAALPVTLGGLGITDPAVEGSYAYLASVIGASHLLHSLTDTLHPANGDSAGREVSSGPKESTPGGSHRGVGGLSPQQDQPERLGCVEEATEEHETSWGEAAAAAVPVENDAPVTESEVAAVAEAAGAAVPKVVAAAATVAAAVVAPVSVGGLDAAFGSGSASPSAIPQVVQPHTEEPGMAAGLEQTEEAALSASPAPVTAAVLAAAVTAAVGEQDGDQVEEDVPTAAASARTSAAAKGASTQGRGQGGSNRRGYGPGVAACAARGKARKKLRAQPAPRRPGAGLGPGPPGPLLGWLLQGQLPRVQERQLPSVGTSSKGMEAENGIRQATTANNTTGDAAAGTSTQ